MEKMPPRLIVYAKDIENITGLGRRSAQRIMRKIRDYFSKKDGELVTVPEVCAYFNLKEELVWGYLKR
jgi:hypothetical protein